MYSTFMQARSQWSPVYATYVRILYVQCQDQQSRVSQGPSIDVCFPQVSSRGRPCSRRVIWGECHCNQSLNCLSFFCIIVMIYGLLFFSCDLYDNIELEGHFWKLLHCYSYGKTYPMFPSFCILVAMQTLIFCFCFVISETLLSYCVLISETLAKLLCAITIIHFDLWRHQVRELTLEIIKLSFFPLYLHHYIFPVPFYMVLLNTGDLE